MSAPLPARPPLWLQAGLVLLLTGVVVSLLFHRLSWSDWSEPHWLEGDPLEIYARAKIAGEQPGATLAGLTTVDGLGAPVRADWTGYPVPDRLIFALTGSLARIVGLIAAIQLMSAFILGLNAASFYLCARWLRWRWEWAVALAVVFALCTYNIRWGITLSFNQTFTLPPLILLCARAARRGAGLTCRWSFLGAALGGWLAQGNPYLTFFSGIIGGGTLLLALTRRTPWTRVKPLVVFLGVLTVGFVAANAGHLRPVSDRDGNQTLVRSLDDFRTYSLRPADWVVPPADHRLDWLGELGKKYHALHHGRGEFFYNYLGLLGLAGLTALIARQVFARGPRRWPHLDPTLGLVWIMIFGVMGGINTWLGTAGLDQFRASTRIGVFAQVWVLLFLGGWLRVRLRSWPRASSLGLAFVVAAAGVWDQTPPLGDITARQRNLSRWHHYQAITAELERDLPSGAMVFQLPVVPFPEAGPTGNMPDYEHLLPYLTSRSLRFSYGALRPAPTLRWSRHVARLPTIDLVNALERAGFSVLWVDPRAYPDAGESLVAELRDTGRIEWAPPRGNLPVRLFRLSPASMPKVPDFSDPRFHDPWDVAVGQPALLALSGWYPLETAAGNRWRWVKREARLGIWAGPTETAVTLRFRAGGPGTVGVVLRQEDREIWRASPGAEMHTVKLTLTPGLNTLVWQLAGATFRPGGNDPRELGFMVENLSMSVP